VIKSYSGESGEVKAVRYTGENEDKLWILLKHTIPDYCWDCQYHESPMEFGQRVYLCKKKTKRIPEIFYKPDWCPLLKKNAMKKDGDKLKIYTTQGVLEISKGKFLLEDSKKEYHVLKESELEEKYELCE